MMTQFITSSFRAGRSFSTFDGWLFGSNVNVAGFEFVASEVLGGGRRVFFVVVFRREGL